MTLLVRSGVLSVLDLALSMRKGAQVGVRSLSSNKKPGNRLGQTSVFLQTGFKIRELPLVVKKVNDVLKISGMDRYQDVIEPSSQQAKRVESPVLLDEEGIEVISGFQRCLSVSGIFRLLQTIPMDEVTPPVAIHVLNKIIDLEANLINSSCSEKFKGKIAESDENRNETFLRTAFINMLLDIVCQCRDPIVILEGLKIVSRDMFQDDQGAYKEKMCEETLVLISEGIFNLKHICEAVVILSDFYSDKKRCTEVTDKFWSGILDNSDQINGQTISSVFATLPHLKSSRDTIFKLVEERIEEFWQEYSIGNVLEILKVLTDLSYSNKKVLNVISQWLKVNIHTLNESETLAVIYCFHKLEYIDHTVISTMERYMKVRGCQIKEKDLVAAICDYCLEYRVQSQPILEGACEYFIEHGMSLSTPQIFSLTRIFGELNFHPPNGFKFWETVEHVLEHKFIEFPPKEILSLFLSFIYIERYPLNFVRKIFNPYFIDRIHNQSDEDVIFSRIQLKVFDHSMKMESRNYNGPYLPKDVHYQNIMSLDSQILRAASVLIEPLGEIVGNVSRIGKSVSLSLLPWNPLYVVDIMIYPSVTASLLKFGKTTDNSQNVAVLIHTREHFLRDSENLIGSQAMRVRQLKQMGFKVMHVSASKISRLKMHEPKLREYLAEKYYSLI